MPFDQLPILNQLPQEIRIALARLLLAAATLVIIILSRPLLSWAIARPLRWLARRSQLQIDDLLVEALGGPTRLVAIALALTVAAQILGVDAGVLTFVEHLARTLLILGLFLFLYRLVDILAPSSVHFFSLTGVTVEERLLPFARTATKLVIVALAVVIIVQEWGYDVSGLVAGLGLFGLAFSLAAKDTAENLFGFAAIVGDNPFQLGDYIKCGDVEGIVERVGVRSTHIRQLDQALVAIPNSKLAQNPITNLTRLSWRWVNVTLNVRLETDRQTLQTLLERLRVLLKARQSVDANSVTVHLTELSSKGLEILVRCYVRQPDWNRFVEEREAINLDMLRLFEELGVQLV